MKNMKKGFTLVEMLIVVVIIGILAAAILPRLQGAQAAARDTARKTALNQIAQGLELHNATKGAYPTDLGKIGTSQDDAKVSIENFQDALVPAFLKNLPKNPSTDVVVTVKVNTDTRSGTKGNYVVAQVGTKYFLATRVERAENANWSAESALPGTAVLCDEVVEDETENLSNTKKCQIKKANFLYLLPIN